MYSTKGKRFGRCPVQSHATCLRPWECHMGHVAFNSSEHMAQVGVTVGKTQVDWTTAENDPSRGEVVIYFYNEWKSYNFQMTALPSSFWAT